MPRAHSGWWLVIPLIVAGSGLGLLVSQINNYTLGPIEEERVSEAAGVNSAGGSFGLSFGLAFAGAIMLSTLSLAFTHKANASEVLTPAQQEQVADTLEHDAQIVSNTHLEELLAGQPEATKAEILRINTDSRHIALQVALLVPLLAGLIGFGNSFRMVRLPDPEPSGRRGRRLRLEQQAHVDRVPELAVLAADLLDAAALLDEPELSVERDSGLLCGNTVRLSLCRPCSRARSIAVARSAEPTPRPRHLARPPSRCRRTRSG